MTRHILAWAVAGVLVAGGAQAQSIQFDFNPAHVVPPKLDRAPEPQSVAVERCSAPPKIDGIGDDATWKGATIVTDFAIERPPTRARLMYDDTALYVLLECETEKGRPPVARTLPRDADLGGDDQVYLAFSPTRDPEDHYLFRINAAGSFLDVRNYDDTGWNPAWQVAARRGANGWTVEAALPYAAFGLTGPTERFGFNMGRSGPSVMNRSWYNNQHGSAIHSLMMLKGVPPAFAEAQKEEVVAAPTHAVRGGAMALYPDRTEARPMDRWIEGTIVLAPRGGLADMRIEAALFDLGAREPVETATITPTHTLGRWMVDLRSKGLSAARLSLVCHEGNEITAQGEIFLSAAPLRPLLPTTKIPIRIDVPEQAGALKDWPVTFGVPFPAGSLWTIENLRLVTKDGREIPSQKEITGRWARDGAIQWVRFDALVNPQDGCFVEMAPASSAPAMPVSVREEGEKVVVQTGAARYVLGKGLSPVEEVRLGEQAIAASAGTRGLYVIDQRGRLASASADGATMRVEAAGPVAACVRIEGDYKTAEGDRLARHITRVEAFAGQPFANITHTLIITEDTAKVWFKEVGWEFAVRPGADPKALFNTDRADAAKVVSAPLGGRDSVWMLQDEHTRFGAGKNHFIVSAGGRTLAEGEECGDWAMLRGRQGALMIACKEAARQHPKEFELSGDRFVLRLFSNRAGEELDFRAPTLAKKWNLADKVAEDISKVAVSAAGWSKTHELRLWPASSNATETQAAALSRLHAEPVYALADPHWIWRSNAMGPLHPKDAARFPDAERRIDSLFTAVQKRGHSTGHYGFMDYYAGPTYAGVGLCSAGRYRFTYGLRWSIWLVYARAGERAVREFAEGTNKAFLDNYLCHADVPGKTRGLLTASGGKPISQLPFYWGDGSAMNYSSSSNVNQFIWLYQLTGYRRAKDAVEGYADGMVRHWNPTMRDWRVLMVFRVLTQCYGFTWRPELRALAEGTFDSFVDRDSEVMLTKNRPYNSSTYKTKEDLPGLIEGWRLFGAEKYREVATSVAEFWWAETIGKQPVVRMNPLGIIGEFLYEQTKDPAIPVGVDYGLRRAGTHTAPIGTSVIDAVFENLPYSMDVAQRAPIGAAPWISYRDYGFPASVAARKGPEGIIDLRVQTTTSGTDRVGRLFEVRPCGIPPGYGLDLHWAHQSAVGAGTARVPKDAPAGAWEIEPSNSGDQFVQASQRVPMVLHAPMYWGLPEIAPALPVYFNLPKDSKDAQILFEGRAKLFDPMGRPFGDPAGVRGWIDLPADRPGLWRFEPLQNRLVRGRNFPPFFAFGDPARYFEPPIAWERQPIPPAPQPVAPGTVFVPGLPERENNTAVHVGGKSTLTIDGGGAHPSGNGCLLLPHKAGTVEFFFKPDWSTFDLGEGAVVRNLLRINVNKGSWGMAYRIDPEGTNVNLGPRDPSHSLYGAMALDNGQNLRLWRTQTLFERDEWVHLAFVWGPEVSYGPRREKLNLMVMRIYVNGKGSKQTIFRSGVGALASGTPVSLALGPFQGAVEDLRISDVARYTKDFTPSRERELTVDANTRAFFPFNGSLQGQGHGGAIFEAKVK